MLRRALLVLLLALPALLPAAQALPSCGYSADATDAAGTSVDAEGDETSHGGGLNACGCHFNRKTGQCHCHQPRGCGCECQPAGCPG